uniref:HTH psq-type domain-containing protein n=1 Tax=Ditylenchus dipsaci TaxID=166011 RepID=A0A915DQY6_9BILA
MATPSKKRRVISLELKKQIIDASVGKKSDELSKQFSLPASSIRNILSERKTILEAIDEGNKAKRVHLKTPKHNDLEEAVLRWFKAVRSTNGCGTFPSRRFRVGRFRVRRFRVGRFRVGYFRVGHFRVYV